LTDLKLFVYALRLLFARFWSLLTDGLRFLKLGRYWKFSLLLPLFQNPRAWNLLTDSLSFLKLGRQWKFGLLWLLFQKLRV